MIHPSYATVYVPLKPFISTVKRIVHAKIKECCRHLLTLTTLYECKRSIAAFKSCLNDCIYEMCIRAQIVIDVVIANVNFLI